MAAARAAGMRVTRRSSMHHVTLQRRKLNIVKLDVGIVEGTQTR